MTDQHIASIGPFVTTATWGHNPLNLWIDGKTPRERFNAVVVSVAALHGVTSSQVMSDDNCHRVAHCRHHAMAEIRRLFKWSYPKIGEAFGRDHSTVMSGIKAHEQRVGKSARATLSSFGLAARLALSANPVNSSSEVLDGGSTLSVP